MKKYNEYSGVVEKFGRKWKWVRTIRHESGTDRRLEVFKVEPYYEFDHTVPRFRPGEEGTLTMTVSVRGTSYTFPARRMPCCGCDGGIRRKLKLRPHGGVCYCDWQDNTVIDFDHDKMTDEQKEVVATYHLDQQMSSFW